MQTGWICPACGRGCSPDVAFCCCGGNQIVHATDTNLPPCQHEWGGYESSGGPSCRKCGTPAPPNKNTHITC